MSPKHSQHSALKVGVVYVTNDPILRLRGDYSTLFGREKSKETQRNIQNEFLTNHLQNNASDIFFIVCDLLLMIVRNEK